MTVYSAFSIPTSAMMSQGHALNNIGNNIANVSTGGYKRTDTNFATVLSRTSFQQSDIGGVRPRDVNLISAQGHMVSSENEMDLAINGRGFFIFSDQFSGGKNLYGRDGAFQMKSVNTINVLGIGYDDVTQIAFDDSTPPNQINPLLSKDGYIVDKNGYFLQGWTADVNGDFTSTTLSPLRIDQHAFTSYGTSTTTGKLNLNLPANDSIGFGQGDMIQLGGTVEAGDIYSVTVNGTQVDYIVPVSGASLDSVRDGLVAAINANVAVEALVTAAASPTTGALNLTGKNAGITLNTSATVTDAGIIDTSAALTKTQKATAGDLQSYNIDIVDLNLNPRSVRLDFSKTDTNTWKLEATVPEIAVAQVDTVSIAGTVEAGDVYTTTINGTTVSYTVLGSEGGIDGVRDAIVAAINANTSVNTAVTAAAGGAGQYTLTSDSAGSAIAILVNATDNGATADNTSSVTTTTANKGAGTESTTVSTLVFDSNGKLTTPATGSVTVAVNFPAQGSYEASSASMTLDINQISQFAGNFMPISYTNNGFAAADLRSISFNGSGEVIARFDNSTSRAVYKIPLAVFSNPNALAASNGNVFEVTESSGVARVVSADDSGYATFLPNTHELSNVDLAGEFSRMIMTQTAYNSSATVFKTVDEMVIAARDLKR